MAESMKDFERELEASFKRIDEGDIISGTVVSVDESGVVLDLKFYAEGFIPVEEFSRVPGFNIKEAVQPGDVVQAMVLRRDDGQGNILLSRADAADVLAWDRLKELQDSGEVLDVVVKGIVNGGAIAYVEGVRGFIPASRLALEFVVIAQSQTLPIEQCQIKGNTAQYHVALGYLITVPSKMLFIQILLHLTQFKRTKINFLGNAVEKSTLIMQEFVHHP